MSEPFAPGSLRSRIVRLPPLGDGLNGIELGNSISGCLICRVVRLTNQVILAARYRLLT